MSDPLPIVDHDEPSKLAEPLGRAFREVGFVGIRGHGVPDSLIQEAYRVSAEFFALPPEKKALCRVPGGAGQRGYTPFGVEVGKDAELPDLKEFFHVGPAFDDTPKARRRNVWPTQVPRFRPVLRELYAQLEALGVSLLRAVALHLGEDQHFFDAKVERGESLLRALHYPPLEGHAAGAVRAAAHEDINLLTLLVGAEAPGLETLDRSGCWRPITALPGVIVCNVGDMLQRMTLSVLRSTTHRVVNPPPPWSERARYSLPFFLHLEASVSLAPLESCRSGGGEVSGPATAGEYLAERLAEIGLLGGDRRRAEPRSSPPPPRVS